MKSRTTAVAPGALVPWKATVGTWPRRVTVYERWVGGPLYGAVWDESARRMVKRSLGHRNRERALTWANTQAVKLAAARTAETGVPSPGMASPRDPERGTVLATVRGVVTLYVAERTPLKTGSGQRQEDRRRGAMWMALYGDLPVTALGASEWNAFVKDRASGALTPHGERVRDMEQRKPIGARGVDADLVFLIAVFNWACQTPRTDGTGDMLIERNPWGGAGPGVRRMLARPRNRAVKRPVARTERFEALCQVADRIHCELPSIDAAGLRKSVAQPSYLRVMLALAYHTGRRITAICRLTRDRLVRDESGAIVAIRWPPLKDEDEAIVQVRASVGEAIDGQIMRIDALAAIVGWHPTITAPVFPQPRALAEWKAKPGQAPPPMLRWTASDWLTSAEALAGLPHLPQGAWHPFRRSWATRRKHLPRTDVAQAGGWKDEATMVRSYEQADDVTTARVILDDTRL